MTAPRDAFARTAEVAVGDPASWEGRTFLTFDIDWAHDDVLADTIALVERADVAATWFVTHDTPLLARLRANPRFELGIHPNFLPLVMQGDPKAGATAGEVVDRLLAIVPEAKSVRSHSLVQSGRLLEVFRAKGLTHDCNAFLPAASGMPLRPWTDWFGMVRVPYFWEDDFWCDAAPGTPVELQDRAGLRGYDFHPIHVYLNTDRLSRYEDARSDLQAPDRLITRRNPDRGVREVLSELIGIAS